MNERRFEVENIDDCDLFFPSDSQLLDGQTPLPTGATPNVDRLTDGMRGVTLLRGVPNGNAGILAVQIGVDAVINNPGTMFALFRNLINKWLPRNHVRWHGVRSGDAVLKRILIWSHSIDDQIPVAEADLRVAVEQDKQRVRAERAIVVIDDLYRYRRPPKRRTWNHQLADDAFTKRLREAQRASGDPWIVVAEHDMQGCFDRIIECETPPSPSDNGQILLTIRAGESRDVIGTVGMVYDRHGLRFKELINPAAVEERSTS